jgi:hypothetical protein
VLFLLEDALKDHTTKLKTKKKKKIEREKKSAKLVLKCYYSELESINCSFFKIIACIALPGETRHDHSLDFFYRFAPSGYR